MPTVDLNIGDELGMPVGLILLCPSGVVWSQQADGTACAHPGAEGVYLPLPPAVVPWPHLCTSSSLEAESPSTVQAAIDAAGWPLTVDLVRHAAEGQEAWWPVTVNPDAGAIGEFGMYDQLVQFRGWAAVLVTENCD